jgi:hypothetical protein
LVAAEDALAVGGMASSAGSPPRRDARPARRTDRHAEAAAEGNRHEAERAYSRRNLFVGLAATAAVQARQPGRGLEQVRDVLEVAADSARVRMPRTVGIRPTAVYGSGILPV